MRQRLATEEDAVSRLLAARGLQEDARFGPDRVVLDERGTRWTIHVVPRISATKVRELVEGTGGTRLLIACLTKAPTSALAAARQLGVELLDRGMLRDLPKSTDLEAVREQRADRAATRAAEALAAGDLDTAILEFRRASVLQPENIERRLAVAEALHRAGRFEEEADEYAGCLELGFHWPRIWLNRGVGLQRSGRLREAIACYDEVLARIPENARALNNKGAALLALDEPEEAVRCLLRAQYFNPDLKEAKANLARAGWRGTRPPSRVGDVAWREEGQPPRPTGRARARMLGSVGRPRDAALAWERAGEKDSKAWVALASTMQALGHRKTAVHCLERAAEAEDEDAPLIEILTSLNEGNHRGAALMLERDGSFRGAVLRGTLAAEAGDYSAALDHLREAAETHPGAALAWNAAGVAELRRGNYFNAWQTLDQAPRGAYELGITWNNRGVALMRLGKLREARAAFERAIELEPDVADWWVNLGVVGIKTKSWAKAEKALNRAAELDPDWPTPPAELAELRKRKGDRRGAKRWQSKASKLRRRMAQGA